MKCSSGWALWLIPALTIKIARVSVLYRVRNRVCIAACMHTLVHVSVLRVYACSIPNTCCHAACFVWCSDISYASGASCFRCLSSALRTLLPPLNKVPFPPAVNAPKSAAVHGIALAEGSVDQPLPAQWRCRELPACCRRSK